MNFDYSPDQKLLLETVANFVKRESPVGRFRKLREDAIGWSKDTWKKMGDLGWLGIPFPSSAGGFGGSFVDAAIVLGEFGTTLVPEPYVSSVIVAGGAIAAAGTDAQKEKLLAPVIAGEGTIALAHVEEGGRFDPAFVATKAEKRGAGWVVRGKKTFVENGHAADVLLVVARTSGGVRDARGISLFAVDPGAQGVKRETIDLFDGRKAAHVTFDGVEIGDDARVGEEGGAFSAVELALDRGAAAACAEGHGVMRAVLEMTTNYLRTRVQFGVKIGTFQALQHRAVDMFIETELAKSTSILASIKIDDADANERRAAISAAKAQLAVSGQYVVRQGIQLHGGIGITDEADVGLYFKRMQTLVTAFGDEEHHVARYASLPAFAT